jgi:hypothetical protein
MLFLFFFGLPTSRLDSLLFDLLVPLSKLKFLSTFENSKAFNLLEHDF